MNLAPVIIFCYRRVDVLNKTISALKSNTLASSSDLIIFADGPKSDADAEGTRQVREYLQRIDGFKSVKINARNRNMGLANSIISGVTEVIQHHEKAIVVEDDLVTSANFLSFMNAALDFYEHDQKVFSISGYKPNIAMPKDYPYDSFFTLRGHSWGWATWQNRWKHVNWKLDDMEELSQNKKQLRKLKILGSDMFPMLKKQYVGKIDSWMIRWCYDQFKKELFTVYPTTSKVENIGYGEGATHTVRNLPRFATVLDSTNQENFKFITSESGLDPRIIKKNSYHYSLFNRILSRLKSML